MSRPTLAHQSVLSHRRALLLRNKTGSGEPNPLSVFGVCGYFPETFAADKAAADTAAADTVRERRLRMMSRWNLSVSIRPEMSLGSREQPIAADDNETRFRAISIALPRVRPSRYRVFP